MEWLATDMNALSRHVFAAREIAPWGTQILERLCNLHEMGVTQRLLAIGAAISDIVRRSDHMVFAYLSNHTSDIVRQWAVYSVNALPRITLRERLDLTRPFAADNNMSVRECAWMAFRPYLAQNVSATIERLAPWTRDADPNIRRFAIEVSRPRSVWGEHIPSLKTNPMIGLSLLNAVKSDDSFYVRTAVGNWLHDAWKSSPEWVESVCEQWHRNATKYTLWIVRRALRTKYRGKRSGRRKA